MMPIESSILLKYHVSCNFMLKYYIIVSLEQLTLNQFFDLSRAKEMFENLYACFICAIEWIKAVLW